VTFREQFVTYARQMARLGTPYCGALREQNFCQCEACFTHASAFSSVTIAVTRSTASDISSWWITHYREIDKQH